MDHFFWMRSHVSFGLRVQKVNIDSSSKILQVHMTICADVTVHIPKKKKEYSYRINTGRYKLTNGLGINNHSAQSCI